SCCTRAHPECRRRLAGAGVAVTWRWDTRRPSHRKRPEQSGAGSFSRARRCRILTCMTSKRARQDVIRELIEGQAIASQEELRGLLRERGWDVTQSTLSRDLRDLRVARVPTQNGVRYALAHSAEEESRLVLDILMPQLYNGVDGVGELVVLHTLR